MLEVLSEYAEWLIGLGTLLVAYFIKGYFDSMKLEIARLSGNFEPLRKDLKENTVALASVQAELKAVWRYIDAPRRASDAKPTPKNGGSHPD